MTNIKKIKALIKKIQKILELPLCIFVIETCCVSLTFIYGYKMPFGMELSIMFICGYILPLLIAKSRWQELQPHLEEGWRGQIAILIIMPFTLLMYTHGDNSNWSNAGIVIGFVCMVVSLLLWILMFVQYQEDMKWNHLWKWSASKLKWWN